MDSREAGTQPPHPPQPGIVMGPNSYATALNNSSSSMITPNSSQMLQSRFPFNSLVGPPQSSEPLDSIPMATAYDGALRGAAFDSAKKKRGRPRKYTPEGNIALGLAPAPLASPPGVHGDGEASPSTEPTAKKHRGRPPGSGKRQLDALGAGGVGFTPHVVLVKAGEDIASKIMAFTEEGPRTVCVLSANGAISNVTLRQPAMSGANVTYEGRFEIISLSGSFLYSDEDGNRGRNSGLSISLAGPDGRVLGGGVAGLLVAATPVQVIVGSFISTGKKSSKTSKSGPSSVHPQMPSFGAPGTNASPPSQGGSSESSDENGGSPMNRSSGLYDGSQPIHNMQMYHHIWAGQTQQ